MIELVNKRLTVLGAQRSGLAVARLAKSLGAKPCISDQKAKKDIPHNIKEQLGKLDIECEWGGHTKEFILKSDLVVLSPGVSFFSAAAQWAKQADIPVLGEIEFSVQFCSKPIIAVTGSNGKTTVSTLIHQLLQESNFNCLLCGNIGFPLSDFIDKINNYDYIVLEVSSFQLESLLDPKDKWRKENGKGPLRFAGFKPHIAVVLNFSQNHLDRHKDLEEYFQAKKRMFINQDKNDFALFNAKDPQLGKWTEGLKAKVVYFNEDTPASVRVAKPANPNYSVIYKVADILAIDRHLGDKVIKEFKGVEHRMEWVRTLEGVDYINDSKSTTAEATMWALQNIERPVVLICGGRDKNIDYGVLRDLVKKRLKRMLVIGEAQDKIKGVFTDIVEVEKCADLKAAVQKASRLAQPGDCVLLSPMCASFDMFLNYEERGKIFKGIVNELNSVTPYARN